MQIIQLKDRFIDHCQRRELSAHTIRAYERDLSKFCAFFIAHYKGILEDLAGEPIREWVDSLQQQGLSASSRKRHLASLKVFCRWLEEEGFLPATPFHSLKLQIKLPKRLPRNIHKKNLQVLFEALDEIGPFYGMAFQTLRLALELLISTGLRISELCHITLSDLDFEGGRIRVCGKGARERTVFMVEESVRILVHEYQGHREVLYRTLSIEESTEVFLITPKGKAATPDYIRRQLYKFVERIDVSQHMTPHMFRHSAATLLLENGVDIRFVQRLLGHASLSTTEIYTHVSDESLKVAMKDGGVRKSLKNV